MYFIQFQLLGFFIKVMLISLLPSIFIFLITFFDRYLFTNCQIYIFFLASQLTAIYLASDVDIKTICYYFFYQIMIAVPKKKQYPVINVLSFKLLMQLLSTYSTISSFLYLPLNRQFAELFPYSIPSVIIFFKQRKTCLKMHKYFICRFKLLQLNYPTIKTMLRRILQVKYMSFFIRH